MNAFEFNESSNASDAAPDVGSILLVIQFSASYRSSVFESTRQVASMKFRCGRLLANFETSELIDSL